MNTYWNHFIDWIHALPQTRSAFSIQSIRMLTDGGEFHIFQSVEDDKWCVWHYGHSSIERGALHESLGAAMQEALQRIQTIGEPHQTIYGILCEIDVVGWCRRRGNILASYFDGKAYAVVKIWSFCCRIGPEPTPLHAFFAALQYLQEADLGTLL